MFSAHILQSQKLTHLCTNKHIDMHTWKNTPLHILRFFFFGFFFNVMVFVFARVPIFK